MDEFVVNDYYPETKYVSPGVKLIEEFARVWREIGQPNTDGLIVLVAVGSYEWDWIEDEILGMPVYSMPTLCGDDTLAIGLPANTHNDQDKAQSDFARAWRTASWY